jgi:hypothetical protein
MTESAVRPQVLIIEVPAALGAAAWDGTDVIDRLGDAFISSERYVREVNSRSVFGYRIVFDSALIRNTVAHGIGCGCGYITHLGPVRGSNE